jgi:predicted small lipoprotein YifL
MRKVYSIAAFAVLGLIFQACGLKGPLRLPDGAKPADTTQPTPKAPATPPTADQPGP